MSVLVKFQGRWVKLNPRLSASNEWQTIINKSHALQHSNPKN